MSSEYGSPAYRASVRFPTHLCSDDGRTLLAFPAIGGPDALDAIDVVTGEVTPGPPVSAVATSGDLVAVAADDEVRLLRLPDLEPVRSWAAPSPTVIAMGGATIAAAGGSLLVIAGEATSTVVLPEPASCVAVSPDGSLIAVGAAKGPVLLVDAAHGKVLRKLTGPRSAVTSLAVSAEHDVVVAATGTRVLGWSDLSGKPKAVTLWAAKNPVRITGITPGGQIIAEAATEATASLDPVSGAVTWSTRSYGPGLVVGDRIYSSLFNDVRSLDPATGVPLGTWTTSEVVRSLCGGGDTVVGSGFGSRPLLFPAGSPAPAGGSARDDLADGHAESVVAVAFDGDRFATYGRDSKICVWQRGRPASLHTLRTPDRPSARIGGGLALAGVTVWAEAGRTLYRWTLGDPAPQAVSEHVKDDAVILLPLPDRGQLLVGCENTRSSYGMFYLVDALSLEIIRSARQTRVAGVATYLPGAATFEMVWPIGRRTFSLETLEPVAGKTGGWDIGFRARFVTPDGTLLGEIRDDGLYVTDMATEQDVHRAVPLPPTTGASAMAPSGAFATVHADAIRIWDLPSATVTRTLPLPPARDGFAEPHWFPDESAFLVAHVNGRVYELEVPQAPERPS